MSVRRTGLFVGAGATTDRKGEVSFVEFSVPDAAGSDRAAEVSWFELTVPSPERAAELSWLEFLVPDAARNASISFVELSVPDEPRAAELSFFEFSAPDVPRRSRVSFVQLVVPQPSRSAEVSFVEFSTPDPRRAAELSFIAFSVPGSTTGPFAIAGASVMSAEFTPSKSTVEVINPAMGCAVEIFIIKQYSTRPVLRAKLLDPGGAEPNFSGATGQFHMAGKVLSGTLTLFDTMQTDSAGNEYNAEYVWADGDTDEEGTFTAEFEVTFAGGGEARYPNDKNPIKVKIPPSEAE